MKKYFVLIIIILNSLSINAQDSATAVYAIPDTILCKDTVNINVQLKSNVETLGITENVFDEELRDVSVNVDALKKVLSSTEKKINRSSGISKVETSSNIKKQNDVALFNSAQDCNMVVPSIDSLKYAIESMSQKNDSILTILSCLSNKSEKIFKIYNNILFLFCIVALFSLIIIIKKYREIILSNVTKQTDVISKLQNCISLIEKNKSKVTEEMQSITNQSERVLNQVNHMGTSLKAMDGKINVISSKLNDMSIVQPIYATSADKQSVESEESALVLESANCTQITDVQYNDAISEFERINNRLFNLRKYRNYSQELLRFLSTGEMNKKKYTKWLNDSDLSEDGKAHLKTILYDIERFNSQRRELISMYIMQQKLTRFDVRFPLLAEFDDKLDHHFKGDDVADGDKIIRVCKLGYYFPNSHVAPYRVKCEVDTEKRV